MKNRLLAPTFIESKDAIRPIVSDRENSRMVLFNPSQDGYELRGTSLYLNGEELSMSEVIDHVLNYELNVPLDEPVLALGIWSFLNDTTKHDLRNNVTVETTVNEMSNFFGVSTGKNGFQLVKKLKAFNKVYGVIIVDQHVMMVFPFLEVEDNEGKLKLTSPYLHRALHHMLQYRVDNGLEGQFNSEKCSATLVAAKNKTAALIVVELVNLVVLAGTKVRSPHISLETLSSRIPELRRILFGQEARSVRNKQLLRAFSGVHTLLEEKTTLYREYVNFHVRLPHLNVSNPKAVVYIFHSGKIGRKGAGSRWSGSGSTKKRNGSRKS